MKKSSLWLEGIKMPTFPILSKNIETDILIIGGGLTGIETALELSDTNYKITLIDKGNIGHGMSGHTTGKLTFLQDLVYQNITNTYNKETSYLYYQSQKEAIDIVRNNVKKYNIDCDLVNCDSYLFTNDKEEIAKINEERDLLKTFKVVSENIKSLPNKFPCFYGIKVSDTAVFHPVKYIYKIAEIVTKKNIKIYENTKAISIKDNIVKTDKGDIKAKYIIMASHYPFTILKGMIPFKTHIENSYVLASKIDHTMPFSAITSNNPTYSMRYLDSNQNYFIFSTNSHKTSNCFDYEKQYNELISKYEKNFNQNIDYIWHAHDLVTNDYLPYIGELDNNVFIATGYNKWGMTNSIIAGNVIADLIKQKDNKYTNLFSFDRSLSLLKTKNFLIDTFNITKTYIKTKLSKNHSPLPDNVKIKYEHFKKIGIYTDKCGNVHKVNNKCPHMGCNLIFNNFDKSWDCPCHGSRYDIDGNIITGPSTESIKKDN